VVCTDYVNVGGKQVLSADSGFSGAADSTITTGARPGGDVDDVIEADEHRPIFFKSVVANINAVSQGDPERML